MKVVVTVRQFLKKTYINKLLYINILYTMNNKAFADLFNSPLISGNSYNTSSTPSLSNTMTSPSSSSLGTSINNPNTLIKSFSYHEDKNLKYRKAMEDYGTTIPNLTSDYTTNLFGIFDGHGGTDVVKYIKDRLPLIIKQSVSSTSSMKSILTNAFIQIDNELRFYDSEHTGSTATIITIQNNTVHCANVGDSHAYLLTKCSFTQITTDHKCTDENEAKRITQQGGTIQKGRVNGQLVLSRTLGDLHVKQYGVIALPSISVHTITNETTYCVIASDGVWDVIDGSYLLTLSKAYVHAGEFAKKIVESAIERGSKDNVSCVVIGFI